MRKFLIFTFLLANYSLFIPVTSATSPVCTGIPTTTGTYFQNFSSVEYSPEGLLILHFRINSAMAGANRTIDSDDYLRNDECDAGT
ncbi:MAG: hypothetical protein AAB590_02850, partial [Patescibacteria group bacterium]